MKLRYTAALLALSLSTLAASAQTSTWKIDPVHSSATFVIGHLMVSNVHGSIMGVQGAITLDEKNITKSNVTATLDLTTINTGVVPRDKDLKSDNFFDVEKFPAMTFKSTAITNKNGKLQMIGDLTIKDVTKSVTLDVTGPSTPRTIPATATAPAKTISGFTATGIIKRSDFTFAPKSLPASIADEVKMTIDVEIDKQ